jgi:hypothetical protein
MTTNQIAVASALIVGLGLGVYTMMQSSSSSSSTTTQTTTASAASSDGAPTKKSATTDDADANSMRQGEVLFFAMTGEPLLPGAYPTLAVSPQKLQCNLINVACRVVSLYIQFLFLCVAILSLPDFVQHPVVAAFKLTSELRSVQSSEKSFENIMLVGTLASVRNFNRQNSTMTVYGLYRVKLLSIRQAPNGQTYAKVEELSEKLDITDKEVVENHQVIRDCMKQLAAVSRCVVVARFVHRQFVK